MIYKNYNTKPKDYKIKHQTQNYKYFSTRTQKSDVFVKTHNVVSILEQGIQNDKRVEVHDKGDVFGMILGMRYFFDSKAGDKDGNPINEFCEVKKKSREEG